MKVCPKCNLEYEDKFSFCRKCGGKLDVKEEKRYCPKCGKEIKIEGVFCPFCGTSLVGETILTDNLRSTSLTDDSKSISKNQEQNADDYKEATVQHKNKINQAITVNKNNDNISKSSFEFKFLIAAVVLGLAFLWFVGSFNNDSNIPRKETVSKFSSVMMYSTMQEDQLNAVKKAFEKKYPNIKMDYYFAGTGKVKTKIFTEAKGGQVDADIIWVGDPVDNDTFKRLGLLQKYSSPEAVSIDKFFIDPDGYYTGSRMMNMGIIYNTNKVKKEQAPKTWNDLLDPKWKDQIVMADPNIAGTTKYAVIALMNGKEYGLNYFEKLKANGAGLQSGTSDTHKKVADGTYKVGIGLDYVALNMKAKGNPIDFMYLDKGIISIFSPVALIKGSKNEKNAKLLYDFILSKEGQEVLVANNLLSVRNDVKQKGENAGFIAKRGMNIDLHALATNSRELLKRFNSIFKN